jgi:hypothetical protein
MEVVVNSGLTVLILTVKVVKRDTEKIISLFWPNFSKSFLQLVAISFLLGRTSKKVGSFKQKNPAIAKFLGIK